MHAVVQPSSVRVEKKDRENGRFRKGRSHHRLMPQGAAAAARFVLRFHFLSDAGRCLTFKCTSYLRNEKEAMDKILLRLFETHHMMMDAGGAS
jgi:hypothetical protein